MKDLHFSYHPIAVSILIVSLASASSSCAQSPKTAGKNAILQDEHAKASYAVGVEMGTKMKGLTLDADSVARGVKDGLTGVETLLSEAEMQALLETLRKDYRAQQQDAQKQRRVAAGAGVLAHIRFAFKPDSSLSNGTYAALPDWVSPKRFSAANGQDTIQVMAGGLDATGQRMPIAPTWKAADPDMIEIVQGEGEVAEIKVKTVGESTVAVTAGGISTTLRIKAEDRAGRINVQLTQSL
jgi:Domain amino terminal to FKBP-type peptidyl-prolyl isomerase